MMKKILILSIVLLLCSCAVSSSEDIRKPAVAGAFYPEDKTELTRKVDDFLTKAEKIDIPSKPT